jgi:hypothetical protein
VGVAHGLSAVGIGAANALVAANNGVAQVLGLEAGEGVCGRGLGHVNTVEAEAKVEEEAEGGGIWGGEGWGGGRRRRDVRRRRLRRRQKEEGYEEAEVEEEAEGGGIWGGQGALDGKWDLWLVNQGGGWRSEHAAQH